MGAGNILQTLDFPRTHLRNLNAKGFHFSQLETKEDFQYIGLQIKRRCAPVQIEKKLMEKLRNNGDYWKKRSFINRLYIKQRVVMRVETERTEWP